MADREPPLAFEGIPPELRQLLYIQAGFLTIELLRDMGQMTIAAAEEGRVIVTDFAHDTWGEEADNG